MIEQRRHQWRSLAGGELSPEMYGRIDLPRHAIGLKRCYNAVVTPQGAVENRAGSRFITPTNGNQPAWLAAFVRQDGQGFLLEFGDQYLRVVGGGNLVNEETDPGDTIDVLSVDIWVTTDGLPVTPALFTTDGPHGFVAGDAIRFQGFTLVNPDQAGNNILASFMNTTWYVATVPSATTFTISSVQTPPIAYATLDAANLNFELGATNWTFTEFGPTGAATTVIENAAPRYDGSWRLRIQVDNPLFLIPRWRRAECDTHFPAASGEQHTVTARAQCFDSADETRAELMINWYDASDVLLSTTYLAANGSTIIAPTGANGLGGGIIGEAAVGSFTELSVTGTAPLTTSYFKVAIQGNYQQSIGEGGWYFDAFTAGNDGRATWEEFSDAPYNGLVNTSTVALASATTPVNLSPTYSQSHIRFAEMAQFVDDLVIAHKLYPTAKLTRVSDNEWTFTAVTFNNALAAPANIAVTAQGTPGSPAITYTYTVTATNDDNAESVVGSPDTADNTLRTVGNFNEIIWDAVSTTFRYNIYKGVGAGSAYGYIGSSLDTDFTDDNISPDFLRQPAEIIATFNTEGEYPGTVCFFEQRMVLGATVSEPQAFWASGLAAFDYFKASPLTPQDDQAFTFELMSRKAAPIIHSLADPELLFFTPAGVHRVVPVDTELFTPTTVASRTASAFGAHELAKPQEAGNSVLYPIERGAHLYELKPADGLTGYESNDLSVIAAHLIDNKDWVQTAFRRSPDPIWFGLRNDGVIVGLTYMPEQQVYAWHQHALPGAFIESIAVVPEGKVDSLYVVARRMILDNTVRYIERIEPRNFGTNNVDAFFLDSGITYRGTPTSVVTGLDHLEDQDVMVLADGRVAGPYTVALGQIEIDVLASVIHVGLPYTTEIETLPLAYVGENGYGVGIMKNVSQLWIRIKQSLGFTAGPTFADQDQRPLVDDAEEELGSVPSLRDGPHDIMMLGTWTIDSTVCIKQTQPLPMTITGLAADYVDG